MHSSHSIIECSSFNHNHRKIKRSSFKDHHSIILHNSAQHNHSTIMGSCNKITDHSIIHHVEIIKVKEESLEKKVVEEEALEEVEDQ
jgi:hypothetical protein